MKNNDNFVASEFADSGLVDKTPSKDAVTVQDICELSPFAAQAFNQLGFTILTPVQQASLPLSLQGHNLLVQARTGSGKTLSYALPLMAHVAAASFQSQTVGIIVAPTRELAQQIAEVLTIIQDLFSPVIAIGGAGIEKQIKAIDLDARVVVGTPGRIIDLIKRGEVTLKSVRFFVLDEADEMLSMGFFEEVEQILREIPNGSQGIFTSATLSDRVTMLAGKYLTRYEKVVVCDSGEGENYQGKIEHFYLKVADTLLAKIDATERVITKFTPRSTIIFCNTKSDTDFVEVVLRKRGVQLCKINSDLPQAKRDSVLRQFRDESISIMVATDVAARGLDIDHVDLVIHYSLPETIESYTHRSGRTGRAGRDGRSVSLVGPAELLTLFQMRKSGKVALEELQRNP